MCGQIYCPTPALVDLYMYVFNNYILNPQSHTWLLVLSAGETKTLALKVSINFIDRLPLEFSGALNKQLSGET